MGLPARGPPEQNSEAKLDWSYPGFAELANAFEWQVMTSGVMINRPCRTNLLHPAQSRENFVQGMLSAIHFICRAYLLLGKTGASCYRGRLLQGHFMQNYYIDGEIAGSSFILIHQGNHWRNKTIDARELYEIGTQITFYTPETMKR